MVAMQFGFAITVLAYATAHASGGHINCAVTWCRAPSSRGLCPACLDHGCAMLRIWASMGNRCGSGRSLAVVWLQRCRPMQASDENITSGRCNAHARH
jgi:hypothetical protein